MMTTWRYKFYSDGDKVSYLLLLKKGTLYLNIFYLKRGIKIIFNENYFLSELNRCKDV